MHSISSQTETFTDVSDRMTKLKDELKELQDSFGKKGFIPENISNDTQMKALTSFTKERFSCVYSFLNVEEDLQTGNFCKRPVDIFFLFLVKLRTGISNEFLSVLFEISDSTVSRYFTFVMTVLYEKLKLLHIFPSKSKVVESMPRQFYSENRDCRVIVDCTEFPIQKPNSPAEQQMTFSFYKNTNTLKDEIASETAAAIKDDVQSVNNNLASFATSGPSESSRNQADYHLKDWPQAPDPTKDYTISSRNEEELQSHGQHFHSDDREAVFQQDLNINKLKKNMGDQMLKLDSIIQVLQEQNSEIQRLQKEVKVLRHDQKLNQSNSNDNMTNKLEHLLNQNLIPHYSKLENLVLKLAEEDRRRSERELMAMSDEISATFGNKLDNTLKQELSTNIVPPTDTSLRDSFAKHLKGKPFMDSISQILTAPLQGVVQSACKDVFQNSVVPSFDKACQHLFQQLNEQFNKGTVEYIQALDKHAQKTCATLDGTVASIKEEISTLVSGAQQAIHTQAIKVENHSLDLMKQHEMLLSDMRQVVQEEVKKALREQTTAVLNSRSTTPVPHADPQFQKQQLMQLVKQGNINEAFQQALSAMDVQLVLFLCESVNVDLVFGSSPCPLQQHVLLSLVNQLSADFNTKTEIRVRYIEDVIASLDSNDPIIRDHIRSVLENLQQRVSAFLFKNPNHRFTRNLRRISLAIDALIKC
ncbi:Enhancer of mRNA-decapping protein 4 [Araneus ventricosus]|uniref:Enhancer of mRNA-decapping protein 4 n=1 Tax=Araneus ventricosus TaxID=182803 RepID=A0A4Y2MLC9_ARAVE|nr:Enhancer of mRNA-decapping protein 4 [Araneus ventricosus]